MPIRQYACAKLTATVVLLQWSLLLTLWVTPTWTPPKMKFFELLWAWLHRPTFYPLVALVVGGPVLSVLAWAGRGTHRIWLVISWVAFAGAIHHWFSDRFMAMLRVLWWMWAE